MPKLPDEEILDETDELPEELEDYEYELRLAEVSEDDDDGPEDSDDDSWLAAQREARSRRVRRGRKSAGTDWVNDAFEDYLASRSVQSRARRP